MKEITIATRESALALWQANFIRDRLIEAHPGLTVHLLGMTTKGDRWLNSPLKEIGGKGLFTEELEEALRTEKIDCAVHSMKDLPTEKTAGIYIGAIPERGNPRDAMVSRDKKTLSALPKGATIGTSSVRRKAQLLHQRPDLKILDI